MQRQAMYPKRKLYCNKWQNLKAKHKWECGMWLSAEERHKHRQALCKRQLHNCNSCEECNIRVVLMVCICHHILDAEYRKPDAGAASVIYNAMHRKNRRHGTIAAARDVCNAIRRVWFSVRGYQVLSEPSEPSGTPGCFRRKLELLLMTDGSSIVSQL